MTPANWKNSLFFLLIPCLMVPVITQASAVACHAVYSTDALPSPVADWYQILQVSNTVLQPKLLTTLQNHPIVQRLHRKYGQGENLNFGDDPLLGIQLDRYREYKEHGMLASGGWNIQGTFLGAIVDTIFPKSTASEMRLWEKASRNETAPLSNAKPGLMARWLSRWVRPKSSDPSETPQPEKRNIVSWTYDRTAPSQQLPRDLSSHFEMGLLKAANPGPDLPDPAELRSLMNLPVEAKIVSCYVGFSSGTVKTRELFHSLFESKQADIIILSDMREKQLKRIKEDPEFQVISSTDWPRIIPEKGVRYVIQNETRGLMNLMHKAANFSIVIGAGNIFEPLQVGRPVYFQKIPSVIKLRDVAIAWTDLVNAAERTGGGHGFTDLNDLLSQIRATSNQPPKKPMFEQTNSAGETPLDQILQQLERMIDS